MVSDGVNLSRYTNVATIRNVGLVGGAVSGSDIVGGLVGRNDGGTIINNSYNTGSVSGTNSYVGGLVGYTDGTGTITNSYSTGSVSGSGAVGGLVGQTWFGTITNSYSTGTVSGSNNVGGLVGTIDSNTITNSYSTGTVSGSTNVGGLVGRDDGGTVINSYWDNETSGMISSAGPEIGLNTIDMMNNFTFTNAGWDFTTTWFSVNGSTRPFLRMEYNTTIRNSHQLQLMVMDLTADYTLANDIDLSDITVASQMWGTNQSSGNGFVPIGTYVFADPSVGFSGSLDGLNHTINELYINQPSIFYTGLFGHNTVDGMLSNIILRNADVTGGQFTGGITGHNLGTIAGCEFNGTATGASVCYGGIAGINLSPSGVVSQCNSSGSVEGTRAGGIVGENQATVEECHSSTTVRGAGNIGGLVGHHTAGEINNSSASGDVIGYAATNNVGGLVGYSSGLIDNAYATGNASGFNYVGGLMGYNNGPVSNCSATGKVSGSGDRVGGLVGLNAGPVSNCSATGNVTSTGSDNVGGLIGDNSGSVDNCQSYSLVTNNGNRTGGLIGFSNGPVSNSTSFGVVSNPKTGSANIESTGGLIGEQGGSTVSSCEAYSNVTGCKFYTGGLVGLSNIGTTITDCSAYGNVNSIGGYVGGVVGRNQGTILESNAYGDIAGTGWTAGFVGDNTGSAIVQNSSAFGDVTGNGLNGGFAGQNTGLIERSFSMGSVTGDDKAGGFVGQNGNSVQDGDITDCYSQGDVTGDDAVGGFAGNTTYTGSTLTNVYSTGFVTGNTNVGGLVGSSYASTVTDSHWDTDTSGQWSSAGGTGQYDDEMMQQATFANWDFTNIWGIHDANTYPFLLPFGVPAEPEADMEITLSDSADPAIVGSGFSYILTLTNHGLGNAANVHVNMTLPAEVTFVSANQTVNVNGRYITADIPAFENEEIGSVRIDVTLDSYSATPINCTANVTSTTFDPGVFDNETYELTEVNRAPIAVNDAETLDEDSGASTIYVLKNDTDADNDALTITNVTQPNNGTVIIIEVGKNLTYEPDTDWNGINSFTYTISDGRGGIATATVTITILPVDDASVAVDDAYNVIEDSGATTFDVLANDYDVEGDAISISTAIQPAHGSISIATNGLSIDYTPDAGFVGTDSFNYTISGGSEATVTVTVTNINDAPVITTTDVTTAMEAVLYSVDYNATDAVLDTLTWTLTTNASWLSIVAVDGVLSGTPTGAGIYWVNVTVADGNTGVDWTNFTLTVAAAPNTAPVISTTTAPDGTEGQLYSLQINATDADGDILTWSLTTNATWLSINTTGELSGTPTSAGAFWVNVLVDDGNGGTDSANLTLTVTSSVVVVDTDGDGVPDSEDAFPTDPAASLDADNDGYPDAWNAGCTADDSTTGLILDPDPTTPATLGDDDQRYDYTWMLIILVLIIGGVIGAVWWFKPKGPKPVPNEILEPEAPIEESSGPDDSASVNTPDNELEELKL